LTSIREFGFTNPTLSDPDGHVIAAMAGFSARAMAVFELPSVIDV
jgi:hypothetical protein